MNEENVTINSMVYTRDYLALAIQSNSSCFYVGSFTFFFQKYNRNVTKCLRLYTNWSCPHVCNRKLGEQREKGYSCMMSKLIQPFRNYSLDWEPESTFEMRTWKVDKSQSRVLVPESDWRPLLHSPAWKTAQHFSSRQFRVYFPIHGQKVKRRECRRAWRHWPSGHSRSLPRRSQRSAAMTAAGIMGGYTERRRAAGWQTLPVRPGF